MTKSKKITEKPVWLKYTESEVKAIILKLADKGLTAEKIGLVLRDQYGIPKVKIYNLKILTVLKENNKAAEPSLINLENKLNKIIEHNKKYKKDEIAKRAVIITEAKLRTQKKYQNIN